ncbi:MAG: transglycosylase SLT domain-containing protein [Candidatus Dormiibacterota bacterium]
MSCNLTMAATARADSPGGRSVSQLVTLLAGSRQAIATEQAAVVAAESQPVPATPFDAARQAMQNGATVDRYRTTIRDEQAAIYQLAGSDTLAAQVLSQLGSRTPPGLANAIAALQALWTLLGVTDFSRVRPVASHAVDGAAPAATLLGYAQQAAVQNRIAWGYLAAINYIESDFGRNNGPSSAGALGPMQFLPSTWAAYGAGGDIEDPHDAIFTAGRYLRLMGAPGDYSLAIRRYNNDANYVQAVTDFASALDADPLWFYRLYYWDTYG